MTIRIDHSKKILLDADVIIHFNEGERIAILNKIFPNKLYVLDIVFAEVFKGAQRVLIENLLKMGIIEELSLENDLPILKEYSKLKKKYGNGESACMAYCKFNKDVLASSNITEIKSYCEENDIQYLTTMDFIHQAYIDELKDEAECDYFIYNVKSKGSKLPVNSIKEYIQKFKQ